MQYDGILLCHKPYGMTSHEVVNALRCSIGQKKIGHTGTLDPRATGLLILCLGRATKIARFLSDNDKEYRAEIMLGISSKTYDSEGLDENSPRRPVPALNETQVEDVLARFTGRISQKIPAYSAVKVNGRRLYKLSRKGEKVDPPTRVVEIKSLRLDKIDLPTLHCTINCTKGTYIRALANDIGDAIGCGGYLSGLCRTKIGNYSLQEALTPDEVENLSRAGTLGKQIRPIESVLPFPSIRVDEIFSPDIITGRAPGTKNIVELSGQFNVDDMISLKDFGGRIMAIGRAGVNSSELRSNFDGKFFTYVRVLN
jgi:tRNA pseudouridine55 synthase